MLGDVDVRIDGEVTDLAETWSYKGVMYSGVPNLISTFGYINASWTLRADLTAEFACRLLNHMDEVAADTVTPRLRPQDLEMPERDWIEDFSPGYMQRAMHRMPKQGDREPWINPQDYRRDRNLFRHASLEDGALVFSASENPEQALEEPILKAAS